MSAVDLSTVAAEASARRKPKPKPPARPHASQAENLIEPKDVSAVADMPGTETRAIPEAVAGPAAPDMVDLHDLIEQAGPMAATTLELVRLGADETPLIPFTGKCERVAVHYCSEPDIGGYVTCNGAGCVLCRAGRKRDERMLLPVYLPASGVVGVLPISPALRPRALLPQLAPIIKAPQPMVAFVSRDRDQFQVNTAVIAPDADAGEAAINAFRDRQAAGEVRLAAVFQVIANEQLAAIPEVARTLALKGVRP